MEDLVKLHIGNKWQVQGIAISGIYSCVMVENYNICFDLGIGMRSTAKYANVFISHGHHDHCGGLYRHNRFRRITKSQVENLEQARYVVPVQCMHGIRQIYLGFSNLDSGRHDDVLKKLHPTYIPLRPTEIHWVNKDVFAKAFKTKHKVPSQGYTIYERRFKLKDEYRGMPGTTIKEKKDAGIEITNTLDIPMVSYTGDTTINGVVCHPDVLNSELLIMECTFLDKQISCKESKKRGHIHLDDIIEHQDKFKNKYILLCHFSDRYKPEQVHEIINRKLSKPFLDKINILI